MGITLRLMCGVGFVIAAPSCGGSPENARLNAGGRVTYQRQVTADTQITVATPAIPPSSHPGTETAPDSSPEAEPPAVPDSQVQPAIERPAISPGAKFVAIYGNDLWEGTENRPWRHILPSIQKLEAGDTLVIREGTYAPFGSTALCGGGVAPFGVHVLRGSEDAWTTIMGYPGERPKLYNPNGWQSLHICDSSFVRIMHLEVFGESNIGNTSPTNGVYVVNSHHVLIEDVWSHDNGGCGICTNNSNHVTIQNNRVWNNSRWNPYHSSGISFYHSSNAGGENDSDGYSNRITQNLVWNNFEDDSLGTGQQWGVTDGNGIIIDQNKESGGDRRTLIANNVLTNNGGPGVKITHSRAVDIVNNTLFQNVQTRVPTVVNNGEIGCGGGVDIRIEKNIVIPREDNKNLYQDFGCQDVSHAGNVWVRTGAPRYGPGDLSIPTGTEVVKSPHLVAPSGDWTPIGKAVGRGAGYN